MKQPPGTSVSHMLKQGSYVISQKFVACPPGLMMILIIPSVAENCHFKADPLTRRGRERFKIRTDILQVQKMADDKTVAYKYAYGASYLVLGLLGIVANLVESICIHRQKHKTTFKAIVASLNIADGISSALFATIGIGIILFTKGVSDFQLVHYAVIGLNFSVLASLTHVLLSVIHRAVAAFHKEKLAENWVVFALFFVFVWGSACLYGVLSVVIIKTFIRLNSIIIVVYATVTVLVYVPILCKRSQICATNEDQDIENRRMRRSKALTHSVLLTACAFACYLPFAITNLTLNVGNIFGAICDLLIATNPLLDALVYFYINRKEKQMGMKENEIERASSEPLVSITSI